MHKRILSWILIICLAYLSLSACGQAETAKDVSVTQQPVTTLSDSEKTPVEKTAKEDVVKDVSAEDASPSASSEPSVDVDEAVDEILENAVIEVYPEGSYTLFALEQMGYMIGPEVADMEATMEIKGDGTGTMVANGQELPISWSQDGGNLFLTMEGDYVYPANIRDDILRMDMGSESYMCFAKDGTDLSVYELLDQETYLAKVDEARMKHRLYRVYKDLAEKAQGDGIHFNYVEEYEDGQLTNYVDFMYKDGLYWSETRAVTKYGERITVLVIEDGTSYSLDPGTMTGYVVSQSVPGSSAGSRIYDSLYQTINLYAQTMKYVEADKEWNGTSYQAEVYESNGQYKESTFYFDDEDTIVCFEQGAAENVDLCARTYTINAIDQNIDTSKMDLSAYEISDSPY